jgi:hypothetical protein
VGKISVFLTQIAIIKKSNYSAHFLKGVLLIDGNFLVLKIKILLTYSHRNLGSLPSNKRRRALLALTSFFLHVDR